MKKLFLLLFVLSLLIVNANAFHIKDMQEYEFTVEQTQNYFKENLKHKVFPIPFMKYYNGNIECVDGDTIHISYGLMDFFENDGVIWDLATYSFRIAGVDTFDSKSRKMIKKQKKATGLSEKEIKKKAQHGKEYCEEFFIKQNKCNIFNIHGIDKYGRMIVIPCNGEYQRNLVDKGLATIYKGNDLYKLIFDGDY